MGVCPMHAKLADLQKIPTWAWVVGGAVTVTGCAVMVTRRITATGPFFPSMTAKVLGLRPDFKEAFRFRSVVCHPSLETVLSTFQDTFRRGYNVESQLCIFSKGEKVLDTYGCPVSNESYDGDTLQPCFSCTKVVAALTLAVLQDRGVLSYDDLVVKFWPEFAATHPDKATITIAHLLRHEAGLSVLPPGVFLTQQIAEDPEAMSAFLAKQPVDHAPESKRTYHAVGAGFVLNEVVRRADPKGRSIGTIAIEDICKPLGVHYYIGKGYPPVGPKGPHKVEKGKYPSGLWCFLRVWLRLVILGLPIDEPPAFIRPVENMRKALFVYVPHLLRQNRNLWGYFDTFKGGPRTTLADFNSPRMHGFEMPGANGLSNGVGLATIAATLAGHGAVTGGMRVLSERAYDTSFGGQVKMKDAHIAMLETNWTQGGWCYMNAFTGQEGFWGWCGWGGHWIIFNPELDVAIGMVATGWKHDMLYDERMKPIMSELVAAIPQLQEAQQRRK